jgi:hypothetical protein
VSSVCHPWRQLDLERANAGCHPGASGRFGAGKLWHGRGDPCGIWDPGIAEPSSFDLIGFLGSRSEDFVSTWSTCFCRLPIYFFDDWIDLGVADLFEYVWMVDCCRMMQDYFMQRRFWQSMMEFLYPEKPTSTKESFCKTDLLTRWRVYLNLFDMFRGFYFASQTWWRGRKSTPLYLLE